MIIKLCKLWTWPDKGRGRPLAERKKREEREGDIVSDIYSTAFSKVPKVRKKSPK